MKKRARAVELHLAKWISVEYREEVHDEGTKESAISSLELNTD